MLLKRSFSSLAHRLITWLGQPHVARNLAFVLSLAALLSGIATYSAITQSGNPFGPDPYVVMGLVLTDLALFLALTIVISRKLVGFWLASRKGVEGSRLQTRILLIFSLLASLPTLIVAIFSTLFFNAGIASWFDQRVSTAIEESVAVAEAYLAEHKDVIRADVLAMAHDLNREAYDLVNDPALFNKVVVAQASLRSLTEAAVLQQNRIIAQTNLSFSLAFERLPIGAMDRAAQGEVVLITDDNDDKVRALIKLENFFDTYLLVGRFVDNKVLNHMEKTQGAANEYKRLKSQISNLQIKFSIVFLIVAMLILFAALWVGILFSGVITRPIARLLAATERVKAGDFSARVREGPKDDEIATLARGFNRMTEQLERQRRELIDANHQLDARRHFIEMVLSGVSAGVIALDRNKTVTLVKHSARQMLSLGGDIEQPEGVESIQEAVPDNIPEGRPFAEFLPEMDDLLTLAQKWPDYPAEKEIPLIRGSKKLTLLVRIAAEKPSGQVEGYIITFDDVTALISAQRTAAWSDVARRIAHEIKNPLTPIHLAAERLRRKYAKEVTEPEMLTKYTETITRHVGDIGKMVEEFVNFARMPSPAFTESDINELVQSTVFSQQCLDSGVEYRLALPEHPVIIRCDVSQIRQVLINLLKNAEEALSSGEEEGKPERSPKKIEVEVQASASSCTVIIRDNGRGFPEQLIDRLTEPYVTTRAKGSGLGLAIVKKTMEDHNGVLELANRSGGGAMVKLSFPRAEKVD